MRNLNYNFLIVLIKMDKEKISAFVIAQEEELKLLMEEMEFRVNRTKKLIKEVESELDL